MPSILGDVPTETPKQRAGRLLEERRVALDLTQKEIRAAGGPSVSTQENLYAGDFGNLQDRTIRDIETGYRWKPGSWRRVLSGGLPVEDNEDRQATSRDGFDPGIALIAIDWLENTDRDRLQIAGLLRSGLPDQRGGTVTQIRPASPGPAPRVAADTESEDSQGRQQAERDAAMDPGDTP